jgi:hypothetical protein
MQWVVARESGRKNWLGRPIGVMGVPPEALATLPVDAIVTVPGEGMRTALIRKTSGTLRLRTGG